MAKIPDIKVKVDTSDAADAIRELVERLESVCTVTPEMRRVVMEWFGRRIVRVETIQRGEGK